MNNENLNDFYNQNRFNKKLRDRIDSYEPELSDSLWDRIEHGLVKKESRSKRMVWMVYVMAGLLLISGAGLYYLASENKKLADAVRTKDLPGQNTRSGADNNAPAFEYQMPEVAIDVTPTPQPSGIQEAPETSTHTLSYSFSGQEYGLLLEGNPLTPYRAEENMVMPDQVTPIIETKPVATGSNIGNRTVSPFSYSTKPTDARFLKEEISTKGGVYPKVQPYIGLTTELGSTRQKLEGSHAYRFGYEHPLLYKSNGLKAGVLFRSGLYIETGLSFSNTGSNLWYDLERIDEPDTVPIPNPTNNLIAGNRHQVNEQRWMDIPIQIGYKYRMNSHWSLNTQAGLTYSLINSYSGKEPNEGFSALDQAGESVTQPFQNFWSMNMGLGVGYQFGRNWSLDIQGNYRRGLTEMNRENRPNHPDRTAEFMNAKVGITYIFR